MKDLRATRLQTFIHQGEKQSTETFEVEGEDGFCNEFRLSASFLRRRNSLKISTGADRWQMSESSRTHVIMVGNSIKIIRASKFKPVNV